MQVPRRVRAAGTAAALALALVAGAPGVSFAQESTDAASAERISISYDHVHETELANGLDVVVVESHAVPIVTIEI